MNKVEIFGAILWTAIISGLVYTFGAVPVIIALVLFGIWFITYIV
jgi:hypothetical protein